MTPDDVISVLSIQHTGTWFALDLLRAHPDVRFFDEFLYLLPDHPELDAAYKAAMASLLSPAGLPVTKESRPGGADYDPRLIKRLVDTTMAVLATKPARHLLHQHTQSPRRRLTGTCDGNIYGAAFGGQFRQIVPIRDPLLSLLTRRKRNPGAGNSNIIDDFEYAIEELGGNCFFLPIDLHDTEEERLTRLKKLLDFAGLAYHPYIEAVAHNWKPKNTSGKYELKTLYAAGDIKGIEKIIPVELAHLRSRECVLRPFLASLGYKDLLWWSEEVHWYDAS